MFCYKQLVLNSIFILPQITGYCQVALDSDDGITKREECERRSFEEDQKCVS